MLGYPFWLALTGVTGWNTKINKELHAEYFNYAMHMETGVLDSICELAKKHKIAVYLGII